MVMKNKRLLCDTFIVIYPFAITLYLYFASIIYEKIKIGEVDYFIANALHIPFLLIFASFLFVFFIKKIRSHNISLIIGIIEILLLQIPQLTRFISFKLYAILYHQILLSGLSFGILFTLYVILLICNMKNS